MNATFVYALAAHAVAAPQDVQQQAFRATLDELGLDRAQIVRLESREALGSGLEYLDVPIGDEWFRLELSPAQIWTQDALVRFDHGNGMFEDRWPDPRGHFIASVRGRPGITGAVSRTDAGMQGVVVLENGEQVFFEPTGAVPGDYALYRPGDARPVDGSCAARPVDDDADLPAVPLHRAAREFFEASEPQRAASDEPGGATADSILEAEIAFDVDYELYQLLGSSTSAVTDQIATWINLVNTAYERDVGLSHRISAVIIRTNPNDPYTTTDYSGLLNQFRYEWNSNHSDIRRDGAHLLTGNALSGGVIGYALIGTICRSNSSYSLSRPLYTTTRLNWQTGIIAHELGHNWSARHCNGDSDCSIMCSAIGACSGNTQAFGGRSRGSISSYASGVGCLTPAFCPGDANGDGVVDFSDISSILQNWGADYGSGTGAGDADGDGVVGFADFTRVLEDWQRLCG